MNRLIENLHPLYCRKKADGHFEFYPPFNELLKGYDGGWKTHQWLGMVNAALIEWFGHGLGTLIELPMEERMNIYDELDDYLEVSLERVPKKERPGGVRKVCFGFPNVMDAWFWDLVTGSNGFSMDQLTVTNLPKASLDTILILYGEYLRSQDFSVLSEGNWVTSYGDGHVIEVKFNDTSGDTIHEVIARNARLFGWEVVG